MKDYPLTIFINGHSTDGALFYDEPDTTERMYGVLKGFEGISTNTEKLFIASGTLTDNASDPNSGLTSLLVFRL